MRDRIRPTKEHDELLNRLREDGLFATREKGMVFGAALGFAADRTEQIEKLDGYGEGIPLAIFERAGDDVFVEAIAVSHTGDLRCLAPEQADLRMEIFEFYARRGLERVARACYRDGQDPLKGLLDLLDSFSVQNAEHLPGLERGLEQLSRLL